MRENLTMDLDLNQEPGYEEGSSSVRENVSDRGKSKSNKRDSSYLVANDMDHKKKATSSDSGENFYDCIICLDMAKEPILTCCGHLFCWPCFYKLPYLYSTSKECPICKGEVNDSNITPIYGNGDDTRPNFDSDSDLKIPPRPKARRVESLRQIALNFPFMEAIRDVTNRIAAMEQILRQGGRVQTTNTEVPDGSFHEPEIQIIDPTAEIDSLSSRRLDSLARIVSMENVQTETDALQIQRGRTSISRVSDVENGVPRQPRQRRLRLLSDINNG